MALSLSITEKKFQDMLKITIFKVHFWRVHYIRTGLYPFFYASAIIASMLQWQNWVIMAEVPQVAEMHSILTF